MSTPAVFSYADQAVRTKVIDGAPCVLLADVIAVLGMRSSPSQVAQRLPEGVRRTDTLSTAGGEQRAVYVTEAGLYRVVLRSDSPNAEPFIEWVTADVLPAIRETGSYGSDVAMLASLPSSQLLALAAEAARQAEEALERAKALESPARAWHALSNAAGDFTISDAAKILGRDGKCPGPRQMFTWLAAKGWIFRRGGRWQAMQTAVNSGFLVERITSGYFDQQTGERMQGKPEVRVTAKGLERLRELLAAERELVLAAGGGA